MRPFLLPSFLTLAVAAASAGLHVALFMAVGQEPWDSPAYVPLLAIAAARVGFMRPAAFLWSAAAVIVGQFAGWLAGTALVEPRSIEWWPLVATITIPLMVATIAAGATAMGAAAGYWRVRRQKR